MPSFRIEIPVASGLYRRSIFVEYQREKRKITRCVVAFEVEVDERLYQVVRYDNAHDGFHRHLPGFPEPSDERVNLDHIKPNKWIAYAQDEILANYHNWETFVLRNVVLEIEGDQ